MDAARIYDEMIIRYLLKEAGPEEERIVLEWMNTDPNNRLRVETFANTLQLISIKQQVAKINVDEEWNKLQEIVFKNPQAIEDPTEVRDYTWERLEEEKRTTKGKLFKMLFAGAIAASVILFIIGFGTGWFSPSPKSETVVVQPEKERRGKLVDPLMAVVQHEVNTSGKTKQLILPDGSAIALSDSSELTYKEPIDRSRREVYLVGQADFKVAKNKARPFSVISENVATTAIGTVFTVTAKDKESSIRIRLHEGKVVVRSWQAHEGKWTKDIFLTPGQELVYDKKLKTARVHSFIRQKPAAKQAANKSKDNPSIPHYDKGSWFMFNNQPLGEIFDVLADMYDVKIEYKKKDVKDMYFIGTYEKSDSLEKILSQIVLLNNLKLTKQNEVFRIERPITKK